MRQRKFPGVLGGAALLLVICAAGTEAFAQAGSTGGSIGKRDKSVSGVEDAPISRAPSLTGGHMQGTLTTRFDGACQFTADR
jgi:hypothetical protein